MSVLHFLLLILGVLLIVFGVRALYLRAPLSGVIEIVLGLVLLGFGGFIVA